MVEPTDKNPNIDRMITGIVGKDRRQTTRNNQCMTCSGDATKFRDDLSRKEYRISGMCQQCQDDIFGVNEPE